MKESVWYIAADDLIVVRVARNKIQLGCEGVCTIEYKGKTISVPDWLNLFTWKVDLKKWKEHRKKGWLVKLGEL